MGVKVLKAGSQSDIGHMSGTTFGTRDLELALCKVLAAWYRLPSPGHICGARVGSGDLQGGENVDQDVSIVV